MRREIPEYDLEALSYDKSRFCSRLGKHIDRMHKRIVESLLNSSGKTLLDVGVGTGRFATWLAERGFEVVGVDISREMLKKAKKKDFREDRDIFILEDEDILFVAGEEVLNKAIKNLITSKLEGYMKEIIETPREIPFIKSKAELEGFINKLVPEPSVQQRLRVRLAYEVVEVVKEVKDKKEVVKPYFKNILITINDRIKEVILD